MDVGGRVNQALLAEVLHYMDLARQFDTRSLRDFRVVADREHVVVVVDGEVDLSLLRLLAQPAMRVQVRATAVPQRSE